MNAIFSKKCLSVWTPQFPQVGAVHAALAQCFFYIISVFPSTGGRAHDCQVVSVLPTPESNYFSLAEF